MRCSILLLLVASLSSMAGCGGGDGTPEGHALPTSSALVATARSVDVGIEGDGLFVLQTADGQRSYSHDFAGIVGILAPKESQGLGDDERNAAFVGGLASTASSADMMDMLKTQSWGARRIPMSLDAQCPIVHKTGDFAPCVANDVGIVHLRSGPVVMIFLTDDIRGNGGEAETRVGAMAREIAQYFDGAGK